MKISRDYFNYIILELFVCIAIFFGTFSNIFTTQSSTETYIGACTICNLIIFFYTLKKIRNEFFSITSMFVVFMYLFNLGIPISRVFGWINSSTEFFMNQRIYPMGRGTFLEFLVYSFLLITMMQIGILGYYKRNSVHLAEKGESIEVMEERLDYDFLLSVCHNIGTLCIIIGILPYIYGEYQYLVTSIAYGYQNSENTLSLNGTGIGLIGNLFIIGMTMWLFSFQKEKKKFDALFIVLTAYQIIRMWISGDRSAGVILILVWFLIRHKFIVPVRGVRTILYIVVIYAGMVLLKLIELTRHITSPSVSEIISDVLQSNVLVDTILEYGGNVWSGLMVYYAVPLEGGFRYGFMYLASIIGKPLSILGITNSVWNYADFSKFLTDSNRSSIINEVRGAMGGSFSGEWWFNFGWIGILIIPIFGYLLAKFSDACIDRTKNPVLSAYLIYVASLVIWWVRQYFTVVSWYALFYGIVIFTLNNLIINRKINW